MNAASRQGYRRYAGWLWAGLFITIVAVVIILVDSRRLVALDLAAAQEADRTFLAGLFGDDHILNRMTSPGSGCIWRIDAGQASTAVALPSDAQRLLLNLISAGSSYDRSASIRPARTFFVVRFDDEQGSVSLRFGLESDVMEVFCNGSPIAQAVYSPVRNQLDALLVRIRGAPATSHPRP